MNRIARPVLLLSSLAAVVAIAACGAPAEGVGSTGEALTVIAPINPVKIGNEPTNPPAPTWPAPNATYCSANPGCSISSDFGPRTTPVTSSQMAGLGCVGPFAIDGEPAYPLTTTFAVCYDNPAVRAQFELLGITCDTCLPALPAGQIYINTFGPMGKPNCPSGCPGGSSSGGTSSGGYTKVGSSSGGTKLD